MICPYCNNSIEDNSTKCDICGVELSKQDILNDSLKEQDVLNKVYKGYKIFYTLLMTAIGLAISIFFGGCGLFFPPAFGFAIIGVSLIISAIASYKDENVVLKTNYINQWLYTIGFYFFVFGFLLLFDIDIYIWYTKTK